MPPCLPESLAVPAAAGLRAAAQAAGVDADTIRDHPQATRQHHN
jgi:hypothetical protein